MYGQELSPRVTELTATIGRRYSFSIESLPVFGLVILASLAKTRRREKKADARPIAGTKSE
jgi:hypothetical protein